MERLEERNEMSETPLIREAADGNPRNVNLLLEVAFIFNSCSLYLNSCSLNVVIKLISHFMVYVFVSIYAYAHMRTCEYKHMHASP